MIRLHPVIVAVIAAACSLAPAHAAATAAAARIARSVVRIHATTQTPDYVVPWNPGSVSRSAGSGFILPDRRIMTNAHVVSNARFLTVERNGDPNPYPARVLFVAHDCDLALLTVEDAGFFAGLEPLSFGGIPALHSTVLAYGYPIGGQRMSVTRGVVSRIEFRTYAHSALDAHLAIQVDAAINPGNSGGPVIQDDKVVGVAFQGFSGAVAQNTGYMIPTPVIGRFLHDIEDGRYDGYAELAVNTFNLLNPAYRARLGLAPGQTGVVVHGVLSAGSAAGKLQAGDVLLRIDGHPITCDGHIMLDGEYLLMEEIVERKFPGDTVRFEILRDGRAATVDVTLKGAWPYRILANRYNAAPRFILCAGLLFQPLDRNFMGTHDVQAPEILYHFDFFIADELYLDRPEVIVLSAILADPINTYLNGFRMTIVDEVNGAKIRTLDDLDTALSTPAERYVIRVLGRGFPIVIEARQLAEARARIARRYGVTKEKYLGE